MHVELARMREASSQQRLNRLVLQHKRQTAWEVRRQMISESSHLRPKAYLEAEYLGPYVSVVSCHS